MANPPAELRDVQGRYNQWWESRSAAGMTLLLPASLAPFTRPGIDEATMAAVGFVLRSGWLTSNGLKVQAFEAQLSPILAAARSRRYNSQRLHDGNRVCGLPVSGQRAMK